MAVVFVQEAGGTTSSAATSLAVAWPAATTAGNLLILGVSVAANSLAVTLTPPAGWTLIDTPVTALNGTNPITTSAVYYKKNAASESGTKTFTFSQSVNASLFLAEFSGCDTAAPLDKTSQNTQTATTTLTTGTTATTTVANELVVAVISENSNFTLSTPTNAFTLQDTQKSASSGTARISGAFLYKIVSATGAQSTGLTSTGTNPAASKIASFKIAPSASTVQWTSTGATAGPLQFPLGPPDMTGATQLTDPNPGAVWAPSLSNGTDYILNCPNVRSRQLKIVNGRNVLVPKLLITYGTVADAEMVYVQGGDVGRIIHFDTVHLDNNGLQCDAFKTHSSYDNRHIQIRVCKIEKLIGQTSQVHADLLQSSGGIGDLWVEDYTGSTTYDGFMLQREANLEQQTTFFNVSGAAVSGANYVYTTTAAHGYSTGDAVAVYNPAGGSNSFYGGYTVLSSTTTTFTCKRGDDASPAALPSGTRCAKMSFAYNCGSINLNRVNIKGFHNDLQGTASLQSIRFGARTAPQPNAGNPGTSLGYPSGHVNEDKTPLNIDQWAGTLNATNWYGEPDTGDVGGWVEPDEGTGNYSGVRPVFHAAAGGQPAYCDWPNNSNVMTGTKFQQGPPTGGDYVLIQGGVPVPRLPQTGASGVSVKASSLDARFGAVTSNDFLNAYDTFTRSVAAGGLGTADLGGTYTLTGTAADFSVNGSQAVIAVTAAGQTKRAVLANVSMFNQYATATMQTDTFPAGSYTAFDAYVGYVDANNWYRCRVALNPDSTIQIRWEMNLASVLSTLKAFVTTGLTVQTGHDYSILATLVGLSPTILNAYVWDSAAPPPNPVPFQVGASDASGLTGLLTSLSLLTSPTVLTGPPGVSAAGFGAALNSGSTATATHVSVTGWDVWPTRWSTIDSSTISIPDARVQVIPFAPPGPDTKHRWTPR